MEEREMALWAAIEKDPYKAHLMVIASGGKKALYDFVRGIATTHSLCLAVLPTTPTMIQRWKDVSRCTVKEILPHNPSECTECGDPAYVSKLIYEAHTRRAYWRNHKGEQIAVKATIVNPAKLDDATRKALSMMVDSYNDTVLEIARRKGAKVYSFPQLAK